MSRAKPVDLGFVKFPTRAAAIEHFKCMLSRYSTSDCVSKEDSRYLTALLSQHPSASEKVGAGIVGFFVRKNPHYHQDEFWIDRIDGSQIDFSYLKCIKGWSAIG